MIPRDQALNTEIPIDQMIQAWMKDELKDLPQESLSMVKLQQKLIWYRFV